MLLVNGQELPHGLSFCDLLSGAVVGRDTQSKVMLSIGRVPVQGFSTLGPGARSFFPAASDVHS